MRQVNLSDAAMHLIELVEDAIHGETIVVVKDEKQAVQLVPIVAAKRRPQFGSAKGQIKMSKDFDAPLEDFTEYMP